jgi:uncharacterized protein (UPF0276 family)
VAAEAAAVAAEADVVANFEATRGAVTAPAVSPALGIGFRPELARLVELQDNLAFVEVLAEDFPHPRCIPQVLKDLRRRGVEVLIHSISLSLGGAEPVNRRTVKHLDELARFFDAPFVSDHIAFVRAGGLESGHLLPVKRDHRGLAVLCENIQVVQERLSVPLVLENIASTFDWPNNAFTEVEFITAVLTRSDCRLLLDISNLFANAHNHSFDAVAYLQALPLSRLEYVHLAGGVFKQGLYHDTHCHPLKIESLRLLGALKQLAAVPRVMLERDDDFPPAQEILDELETIKNA